MAFSSLFSLDYTLVLTNVGNSSKIDLYQSRKGRSYAGNGRITQTRRCSAYSQIVGIHGQGYASRWHDTRHEDGESLACASRRLTRLHGGSESQKALKNASVSQRHLSVVPLFLYCCQHGRNNASMMLPVSSIPDRCRNRQGFSLHEKRVVDTRSVETSRSMLNQLLLNLPYVVILALIVPCLMACVRRCEVA